MSMDRAVRDILCRHAPEVSMYPLHDFGVSEDWMSEAKVCTCSHPRTASLLQKDFGLYASSVGPRCLATLTQTLAVACFSRCA
jgi:hypothetical protein